MFFMIRGNTNKTLIKFNPFDGSTEFPSLLMGFTSVYRSLTEIFPQVYKQTNRFVFS